MSWLWRSETEIHAAFQEVALFREVSKLLLTGITDEVAPWIASALANPAVRHFPLTSMISMKHR
jgi:hypothetical protein